MTSSGATCTTTHLRDFVERDRVVHQEAADDAALFAGVQICPNLPRPVHCPRRRQVNQQFAERSARLAHEHRFRRLSVAVFVRLAQPLDVGRRAASEQLDVLLVAVRLRLRDLPEVKHIGIDGVVGVVCLAEQRQEQLLDVERKLVAELGVQRFVVCSLVSGLQLDPQRRVHVREQFAQASLRQGSERC